MAVDFSALDREVDLEQLRKDVKEAGRNSGDIPKGAYIVGFDKIEIKTTKDGRPMFHIQARVKEGEYKNHCMFFNRVIYGNRNTPKWGDDEAIKSVINILRKLETETVPEFNSYKDFADRVADIYEEVQGRVEAEVWYDRDDFNNISIREVFDV